MAYIYLKGATWNDVLDVGENMREADRNEIRALYPDIDPKVGLCTSFYSSDKCFAIMDADEVIGLCGTSPIDGYDLGSIWMIGTDKLDKQLFDLIKRGESWMEFVKKPYKKVTNLVLSENTKTIKWLKFCGAEFTAEHKIHDKTFLEFIK